MEFDKKYLGAEVRTNCYKKLKGKIIGGDQFDRYLVQISDKPFSGHNAESSTLIFGKKPDPESRNSWYYHHSELDLVSQTELYEIF